MDPKAPTNRPSAAFQHKRSKSSVLKSIIPGSHQRTHTATALYSDEDEKNDDGTSFGQPYGSMLPPDHPHTRLHLREDSGNRNAKVASPQKSVDVRRDNPQATGENINPYRLKSFDKSAAKDNSKSPKKRSEKEANVGADNFQVTEANNNPYRLTSFNKPGEKEKSKSPKKRSEKEDDKAMKKSKSSTGLSALLSRPRSSKGLKEEASRTCKDKENQTPTGSADLASPPPIWAQFATQGIQEPARTHKIPLNDRKSIDDEISRYTPEYYSPSKQRDFQEHSRPTLSRRTEAKPRPKSECLGQRQTRETFAGTVSGLRKSARNDNPQMTALSQLESNGKDKAPHQRLNFEQRKISDSSSGPALTVGKRGSRVMAAVAAFNGKTKELPKEPESVPSPELDSQAIESAFETLLDARNVPQNTRDKMRSLDTKIKADFISKDNFGSGSASSTEGLRMQSSRPGTGERSKTVNIGVGNAGDGSERTASTESAKKSRPRSRTFTFSKGDQSPSKKQKSERPNPHQRTKSGGLVTSESCKSFTAEGSTQGLSSFNRVNKPAVPGDYISYLRKVQEPEKVEVGKVHKLRQLLRNETVGWVDGFIHEGGMIELIELLYRIIKVEWRVEHEDTLLHETLLCLKGLSTTSSALQQLSDVQHTLFPVLLGMLFDKEKKGPSEFTTRTIIINLLSAYLTSSTSSDLASRARTILSYIRDPSAPEEAQAPEFITSIYHPRPYRVWNKELDNVVKEVFWIFLHHVNIIPYPEIPGTAQDYVARHFPREHPPVPAAPYIGGVEWDATNYVTAHLDLLNGIIAALPTREERNGLRQELKDSSFEKVMGASFRTCKEKFYGYIHEALSTWVGAAMEDGWPEIGVREGPRQEVRQMSPKKSPKKKDAAPQLDMPKLELGGGGEGGGGDDGGWL